MADNVKLKRVILWLESQNLVVGQEDVAIKLGYNSSYLSHIVSGVKDISEKFVKKLCNVFPMINPLYLLADEEKMILNVVFKENQIQEAPPKPTVERTIPYYPDVNASAGMDFLTENGHNYNVPIKIPNVDAQAFINVFGDSMYPKYCSGEIIGIKEIEKDMVFPGHAYVVQMTDGEAYIKYIDPGKDEEHWILRSENEKYKPKQFHLSKIRKVYIIKAVITKSTLL